MAPPCDHDVWSTGARRGGPELQPGARVRNSTRDGFAGNDRRSALHRTARRPAFRRSLRYLHATPLLRIPRCSAPARARDILPDAPVTGSREPGIPAARARDVAAVLPGM